MAEDEEEISEMSLDNSDRINSQETAFLKKYFTLRKKCEQMQQANEKLVNRLQHVKMAIKKSKRERRFLVNRLDEYGDNYKEIQVPVMWEEDQLYSFLKPPPPYPDPSTNPDGLPLPHTDGRVPSPGNLSPGRGMERLASVHPILAGLGVETGGEGSSSATITSPTWPAASNVANAPRSKRMKTERDKHPNAPKKPANAFLLFCQQKRNTVQDEYYEEHNEDIGHQELTKRLAHRWNKLGQEEKRVYYNQYEKEKERYDKEMKEYSAKESSRVQVKMEDNSDITVNVTDNAMDGLPPLTVKTEPT